MAPTPDVPSDRVKTLRDAYHSSLKDPALLEVLNPDSAVENNNVY
jgi:hypothetical protein